MVIIVVIEYIYCCHRHILYTAAMDIGQLFFSQRPELLDRKTSYRAVIGCRENKFD